MSLFDFFRKPRLTDSSLGELRFGRGRWTSNSASCFGETEVQLRIPGTREGISRDSRNLLESLESQYARIKIEALPHFQEHYEPYARPIEELNADEAALARSIRTPEDLLSHIKLVRVWVNAYGKIGDVELGYKTAWDIEHMVGLTLSNGHVTEFSGSVGPWW